MKLSSTFGKGMPVGEPMHTLGHGRRRTHKHTLALYGCEWQRNVFQKSFQPITIAVINAPVVLARRIHYPKNLIDLQKIAYLTLSLTWERCQCPL